MKTKEQVFSTLILVLISFIAGYGQSNLQTLTLEEAISLMHGQNPALDQAREHIKQKEYELKEKRGLYAPQVSVSAKAVSMSEILHLDLSEVGEAITPLYHTLGTYGEFSGVPNPDPATNSIMPVLPDEVSTQAVRQQLLEAEQEVANAEWDQVIQEKDFATLTADFIWPVFTGGKIIGANHAAKVELDISKEKMRATEGVLMSELASRYYGLVLGCQVLEVRKQMLEEMEKHHFDAQKLYENGMVAKIELLHASVSYNEAEYNLKQAERNLEIVRSGLAATLMLDSSVTIIPTSQLFINNELNPLSYWVDEAIDQNPKLKQLEGKKELISIKNKVNKASYLPTMAMMGTYNLADKNLSPYMPEWMVGIGMKWTIANGMARQHTIKASATMQNQVNYAEEKAHADLTAYIIKLYQELQMLMEQKNELESTLDLAQEYSASTNKAFSEGFATSSAVVEAYSKVAQVKALRLKVMYDYDVSMANFLQVVGAPEQFLAFSSGVNTITETFTAE